MNPAQRRAIQNYRSRLIERGLVRFEVLGREGDRELIRSVAKALADEGTVAEALRSTLADTLGAKPPKAGGILAALRNSPLVGSGLDLKRSRTTGRKVEL